jgi:hypothetical protein
MLSCVDDPTSPTPEINPGCVVRVTGGPLSSLDNPTGICQWSNSKRVALLMQAMSGKIIVEFDIGTVEPVP